MSSILRSIASPSRSVNSVFASTAFVDSSTVNTFNVHKSKRQRITAFLFPLSIHEKLGHSLISLISLTCVYSSSYSQAPTNDNCSSATILYSDGGCYPLNQTTVNATTQSGEETKPSCWGSGQGFDQTVWYTFQATATSMYVETRLTDITGPGNGFNTGRWDAVVYNSNSCVPGSSKELSCKNENSQGSGDELMINNLTGLTVGNWYLIQIGYRTGSFKSPVFCIDVGDDYTPSCSTCASPCGTACEVTVTPSVTAITTNCSYYEQRPYLEGSKTSTQCYTFTPTSTPIALGLVITSTCPNPVNSWGVLNNAQVSSSNTSSFSWSLTPSSTCSGTIASGSSTSGMDGITVTVGTSYTYCYTLQVPSDCLHTAYYPYFDYPLLLPIVLTSFTATSFPAGVELNWSTASELNNDYFAVQHSSDGENFDEIGIIRGAGTSTHPIDYEYTDSAPDPGINYYRLAQHDFDGAIHYSDVTSANVISPFTSISIVPNPVTANGSLLKVFSAVDRQSTITIYDALGKAVYKQEAMLKAGKNIIEMDFSLLHSGVYNLILQSNDGTSAITFIK